MKISNVGGSKSAPAAGRKKKTSAVPESRFADDLREASETGGAPAPVESGTVNAVESILAVQEVPDATEDRARSQARQYADDVLERLEAIRRDILTGAVSKEQLANLAHRLRAQNEKSDDPRLNAIIDEIELRARVEIAKLTRDI
ncbi:MAG: flagellar assembly protein FliX [Rhodospirillales bacterium]|nr:flagellar assembly protein FliX [Rhodospirillales bacterium]